MNSNGQIQQYESSIFEDLQLIEICISILVLAKWPKILRSTGIIFHFEEQNYPVYYQRNNQMKWKNKLNLCLGHSKKWHGPFSL